MMTFEIRELADMDRPWVKELMEVEWGGSIVVSRGRVHEPSNLPGFIALDGDRPVGLVTYNIDDRSCELVTINSFKEGIGVGAALVESVVVKAKKMGAIAYGSLPPTTIQERCASTRRLVSALWHSTATRLRNRAD